MILARTHLDLHNVRGSIERTKKLSDNVIGIGPLGIGLDAVLNVVPGAGALYSALAGLMLIYDGIRARASGMVLIQMGGILLQVSRYGGEGELIAQPGLLRRLIAESALPSLELYTEGVLTSRALLDSYLATRKGTP